MNVLKTIKNGFIWIFLNKEDNTWKEFCNKYVNENTITEEKSTEEIKLELKEKIDEIIEQTKVPDEKPIVIMNEKDYDDYYNYYDQSKRKDEWKRIICNYMYDCDDARAAVTDLLVNNRDTWYIVAAGLEGRAEAITYALEKLTNKKWEFLGEVESSIYGWKVNYEKTLRGINLEKDI